MFGTEVYVPTIILQLSPRKQVIPLAFDEITLKNVVFGVVAYTPALKRHAVLVDEPDAR